SRRGCRVLLICNYIRDLAKTWSRLKHGFEYCRPSNLIVEQELERQRPLPQFKSGPGSRPGEQLPERRVVSDRQPSDSVRRAGNAGSNPAGVTTETGLVVPARTRPKDPLPENS